MYLEHHSLSQFSRPQTPGGGPSWRMFLFLLGLLGLVLLATHALAEGTTLPGTDATDKLKAAGTLLQIIDTALFKWGARIFAGLCIMSAGWSLKEQRFAIAIICVIGAIIFGTAPTWVKNIFEIGGGGGVFSLNDSVHTGLTAWLPRAEGSFHA